MKVLLISFFFILIYANVYEDEDNVEPHSCGPLSCFMGSLCFGLGIFSCFTLAPKEEAVLLDYGKYNGTIKEPGMISILYFFSSTPPLNLTNYILFHSLK
jgi:hypothetical protein